MLQFQIQGSHSRSTHVPPSPQLTPSPDSKWSGPTSCFKNAASFYQIQNTITPEVFFFLFLSAKKITLAHFIACWFFVTSRKISFGSLLISFGCKGIESKRSNIFKYVSRLAKWIYPGKERTLTNFGSQPSDTNFIFSASDAVGLPKPSDSGSVKILQQNIMINIFKLQV